MNKIVYEANFIRNNQDSDKGCNSAVGRIGGKQIINLQRGPVDEGCFRIGSILHEFLHALGFIHMQNVHNRDEFVDIQWQHVDSGRFPFM